MKNERNAGRKPIFSVEQLQELYKRHKEGESTTSLAKEMGVSRQTMTSYIVKCGEQELLVDVSTDACERMACRSLAYWRKLNEMFVKEQLLEDTELPSYTMRMEYMNKDKLMSVILVDWLNRQVLVYNDSDDVLHLAFGNKKKPDWNDFLWFLESRCFPKSRFDVKAVLTDLGLDSYDELAIIEKTGGRIEGDFQWLKLVNLV